jgi:serine/threonine protein kinase
MDTTTQQILGVDEAELSRLLQDAGAPHDEVPRLLRKLRTYFVQGGAIDPLLGDPAILESWSVSQGSVALLRAVLGAAQQARRRHKRKRADDRTFRASVRASLELLRVDLTAQAPPTDEYDYADDAFESDAFDSDDEGGIEVNLASLAKISLDPLPKPGELVIPSPLPTPAALPAQTPNLRPPIPPNDIPTPTPQPPDSEKVIRRLSSEQKQRLSTAAGDEPRKVTRTARHILNGQWKLGKCIGQGSFGSVYTCLDSVTGKHIACKMMAIPTASVPPDGISRGPTKAEAELRALCSEIELMRSLEHPNIVRYLGTHVDDAQLQLYIFQEWVPGGSLAAQSAQYGALSEKVVRMYSRHLLSGLVYLHENHIIHRDIKCGNVLIDQHGVAKLADFGASHRLGADGTLTRDAKLTMRGTPYFMAPEVLSQDKFGRRSDVWSSGGVILQMATTHPPWKVLEFKTPMALFYHVASTDAPPPIDAYDLSPLLRSLILRCFERDPHKRAHAVDLLDDPFFIVEEESAEISGDACDTTVDRIHEAATPRPPPSSLMSPLSKTSGLSDLKMRMSLRRSLAMPPPK